MVGQCGGRSKLSLPPAVVAGGGGGVIPEDQYFCFVRVELEVVVSHPVGYVSHGVGEVGLGIAGVLGEREDQMSVVCIGDYVEAVESDYVCEEGHVGVEQVGAE